jgi:peptidoglycan/xylan/chitin deacetylase (PgdA/CDA1 family)
LTKKPNFEINNCESFVVTTKKFITRVLIVFSVSLISVFLAVLPLRTVSATVSNPFPHAKISFTFDDGYVSSITKAAPALRAHGYTGTAYVTTNYVGRKNYMTWAQVRNLQNNYGWEIGSHSVSHPLMTTLTPSQIERETKNSKQIFLNRGLNPQSFATPYGDYNSDVVAGIARHYTSHRPFHDSGYNSWPYTNYRLQVQQVQSGVSVSTVKSYIDQAKTNNTWLILVFHDIKDTPSTNPNDYEYATNDLSAIAAYAKTVGIQNTNVTNGLVTANSNDNLLPDPVSSATFGNGWTTDVPANVEINNGNKGSQPEPATSLQIQSNPSRPVHVFSPYVAVNPQSSYSLHGYIHAASLPAGGEIGFYIDEYDVHGNWISGQYKQTIFIQSLKDMAIAYRPSSLAVKNARLQIIVSQGSGLVVYVDSCRWLLASGTSPEPEPQPVNLLINGGFEAGMSGWRTDNTQTINLDTNGNGSNANPQNSVRMASSSANTHLFSSHIAVQPYKSYTITGDVNIISLQASEIGFYIDEYDVHGNWISGQYITGARSIGVHNFAFAYPPSSATVSHASLQVIVGANSGITAYADNFKWQQ